MTATAVQRRRHRERGFDGLRELTDFIMGGIFAFKAMPIAARLGLIDRKITAILRVAIEQRQPANLAAAARTPKPGMLSTSLLEQSETPEASQVS